MLVLQILYFSIIKLCSAEFLIEDLMLQLGGVGQCIHEYLII